MDNLSPQPVIVNRAPITKLDSANTPLHAEQTDTIITIATSAFEIVEYHSPGLLGQEADQLPNRPLLPSQPVFQAIGKSQP